MKAYVTWMDHVFISRQSDRQRDQPLPACVPHAPHHICPPCYSRGHGADYCPTHRHTSFNTPSIEKTNT